MQAKLLILVVVQPKSLHKLKPSGNGHYQIQAALGSALVKKGVLTGPPLGLVSALPIPPNPHHFGVPHEKQNEMQVAKFIYLNKSSLLIAVHAPKALTR